MLHERLSQICHANQGVHSSSDRLHEIGTHNKGIRSTYLCHPKDISAMFSEHAKFTKNMVGEEVAKSLAKFSQNSKYRPSTFTNIHPTAPSSSSTPSTSVTQPPYGIPLNYFCGQTPPTQNTSMTLYTPEPVPISTIPPTSAILGQASVVPPFAPTGTGGNTAIGVRYVAPHAPHAPPPPHRPFE
jgi:hypothetical protein